MAEPRKDDLHLRLDWPADDRRPSGRPGAPTKRSAPSKRVPATRSASAGQPEKVRRRQAAVQSAAPSGDGAPARAAPSRPRPPAALPRRARPLEAPGRRTRRSPDIAAEETASALVALHPEAGRPPATLPAVADRVDTLTHALIALHALVSEQMSEHAAHLMDAIDGSVAALARRDEEQIRALEDLAAQVRSVGEGQRDLVTALAVLLDRTPPAPATAPAPVEPAVSAWRRRAGKWLLGAAESARGGPNAGV